MASFRDVIALSARPSRDFQEVMDTCANICRAASIGTKFRFIIASSAFYSGEVADVNHNPAFRLIKLPFALNDSNALHKNVD